MKPSTIILLYGLALLPLLYVFLRFFFKKGDSSFRDDLWQRAKSTKPKLSREDQKKAYEDMVDKKILLEHKPLGEAEEEASTEEKPQASPETKAKTETPPFKLPQFRGKAHEILGLEEKPSAERIQAAYRYWMKRYHPDRVTHLGKQYVEQARRRAEQLNAARQALLEGLSGLDKPQK